MPLRHPSFSLLVALALFPLLWAGSSASVAQLEGCTLLSTGQSISAPDNRTLYLDSIELTASNGSDLLTLRLLDASGHALDPSEFLAFADQYALVRCSPYSVMTGSVPTPSDGLYVRFLPLSIEQASSSNCFRLDSTSTHSDYCIDSDLAYVLNGHTRQRPVRVEAGSRYTVPISTLLRVGPDSLNVTSILPASPGWKLEFVQNPALNRSNSTSSTLSVGETYSVRSDRSGLFYIQMTLDTAGLSTCCVYSSRLRVFEPLSLPNQTTAPRADSSNSSSFGGNVPVLTLPSDHPYGVSIAIPGAVSSGSSPSAPSSGSAPSSSSTPSTPSSASSPSSQPPNGGSAAPSSGSASSPSGSTSPPNPTTDPSTNVLVGASDASAPSAPSAPQTGVSVPSASSTPVVSSAPPVQSDSPLVNQPAVPASGWPWWVAPALVGAVGAFFMGVLVFYYRVALVSPPSSDPDSASFVRLSDNRISILRDLEGSDRILTDIALRLNKNKSTIMEQLDDLCVQGLVERIDQPGKKFVFYRLTHAGRQALLQHAQGPQDPPSPPQDPL